MIFSHFMDARINFKFVSYNLRTGLERVGLFFSGTEGRHLIEREKGKEKQRKRLSK